jgi:hypothetical protein
MPFAQHCFVINQLRSQLFNLPAITKADNCQLTNGANKNTTRVKLYIYFFELKIQSGNIKKEGSEKGNTLKQTDTNWIKQLKRHNMLFRNWFWRARNIRDQSE